MIFFPSNHKVQWFNKFSCDNFSFQSTKCNGLTNFLIWISGAIFAQGIIDAGGRNVTVCLQSRTGHTNMMAVVGMLIFTQVRRDFMTNNELMFWQFFKINNCTFLVNFDRNWKLHMQKRIQYRFFEKKIRFEIRETIWWADRYLRKQFSTRRLFTKYLLSFIFQYWYWFPLAHFLSLAFSPSCVIGLNENLDMPVMGVKSNAKPSTYGYPAPLEEKKKEDKEKVATAVLSITAKQKKKEAEKRWVIHGLLKKPMGYILWTKWME